MKQGPAAVGTSRAGRVEGTPGYADVSRCDAADRLLPQEKATTDPDRLAELWEQAVDDVLRWRIGGPDGLTWAAYCATGDPNLAEWVRQNGWDK